MCSRHSSTISSYKPTLRGDYAVYSNGYILRFAATVTIICSILLASAATLLKPAQEENIQTDIKKNILRAVQLIEPDQKYAKKDILDMFAKRMSSVVVDPAGTVIPNLTADEVNADETDRLPIYLLKDANGAVTAYCFPISGKGLWSTVKGYLALDSDLNTVRGITFYSHGETPGLGGEISKDWFIENFVGKKILDTNGSLVGITIEKGKLRADTKGKEHKVDGISGATLTGKGINEFLMGDLERFNPYFTILRNKVHNEVIS
ncbi:MAG: NADH:ubiquinone reductase (Na(+)-transporting) subunit C [Candidatus Marinimicrobia bacterium CG_4_10_14_0_2_um_filter_48_9]|nr:MAG: NADH:ubiquinone reductase (Na(+)-transporting) subunit C [Candidatus Marinimicrobia bacterium CG_4_10_14_0_2_um_filter_48_9]